MYFATKRRAMGATIRIVGNAALQAKAQAPIQVPTKSGGIPIARAVAMAETMNDMRPDTMKPNTTGAKRAGIMGGSDCGLAPYINGGGEMVNRTNRASVVRHCAGWGLRRC